MRQLIYSDKAVLGLREIVAYVGERSIPKAVDYYNNLVSSLELLLVFPASRPVADPAKDPEIRKLVFNKLTIVLYMHDAEAVYIETIADARNNLQAG